MHCRVCSFVTDRLLVREWHSLSKEEWEEDDLACVVAKVLSEPVTRSLPVSWQGSYSEARARQWIRDRDDEGTALLVIERASRKPVGFVILFETDSEELNGTEVRLGYLFMESAWGQGFATELLGGLIEWGRQHSAIASFAGGVERDNPASRRVLEKCGFRPAGDLGEEQLFRLDLTPTS